MLFRKKKKTFFKKKKKTIRQRLEADLIKIQKNARRKIRKHFKNLHKKERRFRSLMKNGARILELSVDVIFVLIVLVLFWKKAKDPDFLNDFGATKL